MLKQENTRTNLELSKKINQLQATIREYDEELNENPNDDNIDNTYYLKARDYFKLGELTNDKSYYDHALASFNQAIYLNSDNSMYIASRAKLYIVMERPDLAAQDIIAVKQLPAMDNKVLAMYTDITSRDVLKLDSVQNEVKQLIKDKKLPSELEGVFAKMNEVITGISYRVTHNSERIDEQGEEILSLKAEVTQLKEQQSKYPALINLVSELSAKVILLEAQVIVNRKTIDDITTQVCTKEEFEGFSKRFDKVEDNYELFDGKVKGLQGILDNQAQEIISIHDSLEQSNVFNKQHIREEFEKLKTETANHELFDYANQFYWSLSNYLLAYRSISTGNVKSVRDKNKLEKIWEAIGSKFVDVTKSIPVVGSTLAVIEEGIASLNDAYKDMKFDRKVAKINQLITNYIFEEDLNLAVASASIKIARLKQDQILNQYSQNNGNNNNPQSTVKKAKDAINKKVEAFEEKVDKMLTKITKINGVQETPGGKLAIKDVILFLNELAIKEPILVTEDTVKSLDKTIAEIFDSNIANTNKAIVNAINNNSQVNNVSNNSNNNNDKCIIALVDEIVYENPLLNHPDLLKNAFKHFGVNKALDLSQALSPELISAAIQNEDFELIMAGMISADKSNNCNMENC